MFSEKKRNCSATSLSREQMIIGGSSLLCIYSDRDIKGILFKEFQDYATYCLSISILSQPTIIKYEDFISGIAIFFCKFIADSKNIISFYLSFFNKSALRITMEKQLINLLSSVFKFSHFSRTKFFLLKLQNYDIVISGTQIVSNFVMEFF